MEGINKTMETTITKDLSWEHSQHHYAGMNFMPGLTKKCSDCYKVNKERETRVAKRRITPHDRENLPTDYKVSEVYNFNA